MSLKDESLAFFKRVGGIIPDEHVWTFDEHAAGLPIRFVERLCHHSKGKLAGKPFKLLAWQRELVSTLYGWKDKNGARKYRRCYIQVARKNGKTLLASALGVYNLVVEKSDGVAEVLLAASTRDQAKIALDNIKEFVRSSALLEKEIRIYRNSVNSRKDSGTLKVVSSEGGAVHGANPTMVICDELHVWPKYDLYEALTTAQGARSQPQMIVITTPGNNRNSLCFNLYQYAQQVRDGLVVDDHFLPAMYEPLPSMAWDSQEAWGRANPSLGEAVTLDFLEAECKVAKAQPSYQNSFKQLYCGLWVSSRSQWIDNSTWSACAQDKIDWTEIEKSPVWLGVDLSSASDTTGVVACYNYKDKFYIQHKCFWPRRGYENDRLRSPQPLDLWLEQGLFSTTDGDIIDSKAIEDYISRFIDTHDVRGVAFDPHGSGIAIMGNLNTKYPSHNIIQVYQSFFCLGSKVRTFYEGVFNKEIVHDGNQLMSWMLSNCEMVTNGAGDSKIDKAKSANKIDVIVAAVMAYGCFKEGIGEGSSSYNDPNNEFVIF